jgi:predicted AlkP superfamily phosphohydrolase/phosphomutase
MRYITTGGYSKIENNAEIKEIMINEDFLHPSNESIAIGFRNKDSSGLIELTVEEFEQLSQEVTKKIHLIKGFKTLGREGAIRFK